MNNGNPIQYREAYLNSMSGFGYLHYPYMPYDLAVLCDGKRVVVKPIIAVLPETAFFNYRRKSYFLKDFRHEPNQTPPKWVMNWLQDRIDQKPFTIDLRLSAMDRFMLEGAIKKRGHSLEQQLRQM